MLQRAKISKSSLICVNHMCIWLVLIALIFAIRWSLNLNPLIKSFALFMRMKAMASFIVLRATKWMKCAINSLRKGLNVERIMLVCHKLSGLKHNAIFKMIILISWLRQWHLAWVLINPTSVMWYIMIYRAVSKPTTRRRDEQGEMV